LIAVRITIEMSIQNTADEMMTIAAARELKDGAVVGISLPVVVMMSEAEELQIKRQLRG
jgi:acyl CoA:acetate/3-ketoacid CoA transferase beta subunit